MSIVGAAVDDEGGVARGAVVDPMSRASAVWEGPERLAVGQRDGLVFYEGGGVCELQRVVVVAGLLGRCLPRAGVQDDGDVRRGCDCAERHMPAVRAGKKVAHAIALEYAATREGGVYLPVRGVPPVIAPQDAAVVGVEALHAVLGEDDRPAGSGDDIEHPGADVPRPCSAGADGRGKSRLRTAGRGGGRQPGVRPRQYRRRQGRARKDQGRQQERDHRGSPLAAGNRRRAEGRPGDAGDEPAERVPAGGENGSGLRTLRSEKVLTAAEADQERDAGGQVQRLVGIGSPLQVGGPPVADQQDHDRGVGDRGD